jgi:hypothetical protein
LIGRIAAMEWIYLLLGIVIFALLWLMTLAVDRA